MTDSRPAYPHVDTIDRFVRSGDLDSALGLVLEWTRQEPTDAAAWATLAAVRERQGDSNRAEEALNEAIRQAPADSSLPFRLGTLRYAQSRFQDAIEAFSASLNAGAHRQDDTHDTLAALALAQCHAQLGQDHEAVLALRQVDEASTMWLRGRVSPQSVRNLIRERARTTTSAA